jgi:hypothetical protein
MRQTSPGVNSDQGEIFEKNEWCHKKIIKQIIYTPILILFGGNVV